MLADPCPPTRCAGRANPSFLRQANRPLTRSLRFVESRVQCGYRARTLIRPELADDEFKLTQRSGAGPGTFTGSFASKSAGRPPEADLPSEHSRPFRLAKVAGVR